MKANVYAQVLSFTSHKVIREVEMGHVDRIDKCTIKRENRVCECGECFSCTHIEL